MLTALLAVISVFLVQDGQANEAKPREDFSKAFKGKDPAKRIEALRRLSALHEEKTLLALAGGLRDPAAEVRKTAAETIGTCTDVAGAGIKGLCATLLNRKENTDVRTVCAKSLARAQYKAEAIDALVHTISGIGEQEKNLYQFGADCTESLNWLASQDLGAGKETPDKWKRWAENKARVLKGDVEKLATYRKSAAKGK